MTPGVFIFEVVARMIEATFDLNVVLTPSVMNSFKLRIGYVLQSIFESSAIIVSSKAIVWLSHEFFRLFFSKRSDCASVCVLPTSDIRVLKNLFHNTIIGNALEFELQHKINHV